MRVGILALQGAVEPHEKLLRRLGVEPVLVRTPGQLQVSDALILPGGESTAMLKLLEKNRLVEPMKEYLANRPAWGICAGAILLAREVTSPAQESFRVIDISVERNAFGRQINSFVDEIVGTKDWPGGGTREGVFIRAPRITAVGDGVKVLFEWEGEPVMVEQGSLLASTFHPELTQDTAVHQYFLSKVE